MNDALSNPRLVTRLLAVSRRAAVFVIAVGVLVILGWVLHIDILKSVLPGLVSMKFNTASCFILSGVAVLRLRNGPPRLIDALSIIVGIIGFLSLMEYSLGRNLGIDELFVRDVLTGAGLQTSVPGRMSPITAINFCIIAISLPLMARSRRPLLVQLLMLVVMVISLLSLAGYIFGVQSFYQISSFTSVAVHTAVTFILLGLGVFFSYPEYGLAAVIGTQLAGGRLARRLLPAAVIIPLILGWLLGGRQLGITDTAFGLALFALSNIIVFAVLIFWTARTLNRVDSERNQAAEGLRTANEELEVRVKERTSQLIQANHALEVQSEERRKSEDRFRALLESAPDSMVIVNQQGNIELVNTQTETLFGYGREEMIGKSIEMLVPERFQRKHPAYRDDYMIDPQVRSVRVGYELYARRKDDSEFPVEISLSPIETKEGILIAAAVRDISERKQAEQEIHKLNTELEQRVVERTTHLTSIIHELDAFNYSVSHDLRTPLRALDGFALAIQEEYSSEMGDKGRRYLDRIRIASQHMGDLIDDLLRLSNLSRAEMERRSIDMSVLAREIVDELQKTQPERSVECVIQEGLIVKADARLLRAALENLLGNAWKFTGHQPQPRIELGMMQDNGTQAYFVRDNGAGFDMQYVHKLFRAFQRLHDAAEFEGTGIGLAIVQRIIQRHGGKVWAESIIDEGATFYFTIQN